MKKLKMFVVGDGAVGKTCLLMAFSTNSNLEEVEYIPTVFGTCEPTYTLDDVSYTLCLWDTPGQPDYDRLRPLSYPETDAFIVCFSISRRVSFENVTEKWVAEVRHHMPNTPILLVATKIDLRSQHADNEQVSNQEAVQLARELGLEYVESSALTRQGVKDVFETAIRAAIRNPQTKKRSRFGRLFGFGSWLKSTKKVDQQ